MKLYAVFGNPISHSLSPFLHNFTFHQLGIDARYTRFLLQNDADLRRTIFEHNFSGANITLPLKESAFLECDEVRGIAQKIGAVNTIVREGDKLIGHNTDAEGFYESLVDTLKSIKIAESKKKKLPANSSIVDEFSHLCEVSDADRTNGSSRSEMKRKCEKSPQDEFEPKRALIIGAGGSARAVAFALREKGIKTKIINRSSQNLAFFAESSFDCALISDFCKDFKGGFKAQKFDCVINATSSSIKGELPLDSAILSEILGGAKIAVDLMYGKKCPFLELAKKRRICALDGSKMLLYQAIKASHLFLGQKIAYKNIESAMKMVFHNA